MAQISPAFLRQLDAELLRGLHNALPRPVSFGVAHALHLIESGYGVSDVTRVDQRLFPLCGKSELVVAQLILLSSVRICRTF